MPFGNSGKVKCVERLHRHDLSWVCSATGKRVEMVVQKAEMLSGVFIKVSSETAAAKTWKEHNGRGQTTWKSPWPRQNTRAALYRFLHSRDSESQTLTRQLSEHLEASNPRIFDANRVCAHI